MQAGREAAHTVDYLITRGERAALIAETAQQAGLPSEHIIVTSTHEDATRAAQSLLAEKEFSYYRADQRLGRDTYGESN